MMTATQRKHLEASEFHMAAAQLCREVGDTLGAVIAEAAAARASSKARRAAKEGK